MKTITFSYEGREFEPSFLCGSAGLWAQGSVQDLEMDQDSYQRCPSRRRKGRPPAFAYSHRPPVCEETR